MERIKIVYNDFGKPAVKIGIFDREDKDFIYLKNDKGITEGIAKSRVSRMEREEVI